MRSWTIPVIITFFSVPSLFAAGVGTSGGVSLNLTQGARPSALGDAFSGAQDDIAGFGFNPAVLSSLKKSQATFLFQRGSIDDNFGQIAFGMPLNNAGWGISVGAYDSGDLAISRDGITQTNLTAQRDLAVSLGGSVLVENISLGLTGKFISSEILESDTARAFVGDFGISMPLHSRVRLGSSIQNIGSNLSYENTDENLPRIFRSGLNINILPNRYVTNLSLEAPYHINEQQWRPAVGLETIVGPLAFRAGYKSGTDLEEFSFGTGFAIGPSRLDYAFGLVDQLDSRHRISYSFRFGSPSMPALVKNSTATVLAQDQTEASVNIADVVKYGEGENTAALPEDQYTKAADQLAGVPGMVTPTGTGIGSQSLTPVQPIVPPVLKSVSPTTTAAPAREGYVVKKDDWLSKIAEWWLGDKHRWPEIYAINKDIISDPDLIEIGWVLQLPPRTYIVKKDDWLSKISRHYYKDIHGWKPIYDANRNLIQDPDLIEIGWELSIP